MLKVAVTALLTLRSCAGPAESRGTSLKVGTGGVGVTVSTYSGCSESWSPDGRNMVCGSPSTGPSKTVRRSNSVTSTPQKIQGQPVSGSIAGAKRQEMQTAAPSSGGAPHLTSVTLDNPREGKTQTKNTSDAVIRGPTERLTDLSSRGEPAHAPVGNGKATERVKQVHDGEQRDLEGRGCKDQSPARSEPASGLMRDDGMDVSRPPARRTVSGAEQESTRELMTRNLSEQESAENSTQEKKSAANKGHAVMISAALTLISF
ncbi:expression site-associated gene (ESAG) protein, putative [Trypanosoma brucei brucei TREU927]|uniref:Expression site-associated gene (ESAG) protein, putative n=1 Tax=Trypanosoma brucei brucei (strain 927/4 GUTat10.1) TaxID=185431 RepID=Q57U37_TRYB2|nr:expression site-associated gene (ESAG) protein, putative [Trypanosoma brucei brucei TREU927]AAX70881.1 expression site-associated gene (ESAG) protein, putative [Trypanosoma brucei]AAZ12082.1 expression site-associated gene (ESAG) protein, putative [Trypanosoma brucei brucei TREU927]